MDNSFTGVGVGLFLYFNLFPTCSVFFVREYDVVFVCSYALPINDKQFFIIWHDKLLVIHMDELLMGSLILYKTKLVVIIFVVNCLVVVFFYYFTFFIDSV